MGGTFSGDGRYVVFVSGASDLVSGDDNGTRLDVFRRDLANALTERVSTFPSGAAAVPADSFAPSVCADGSRIVFLRTRLKTRLAPLGSSNHLGKYEIAI